MTIRTTILLTAILVTLVTGCNRSRPGAGAAPTVSRSAPPPAPSGRSPPMPLGVQSKVPLVAASPEVARATLDKIEGRWHVVGYDGSPVPERASAGDPPRSPMAGAVLEMTGDHFRLFKSDALVLDKPLAILNDSRPGHARISAGYGRSTMDMLASCDATLHIDVLAPHDLRLHKDCGPTPR